MKDKHSHQKLSPVGRAPGAALGSGSRQQGSRARHLPTRPALLVLLLCLALASQGCAVYKGGQEWLALYPGFGFSVLPSTGPASHVLVPVPVAEAGKINH